jgi:hypothetical protein
VLAGVGTAALGQHPHASFGWLIRRPSVVQAAAGEVVTTMHE